MASSINKVTLLGHLGKAPELRFTAGGKAVASLSMATNKAWKDKETGELKESTQWHRIVLFGPFAQTADKYLTAGSQILVEGELVTRKYTDGDGVAHYITEVRGNELHMLGGARKEGAQDHTQAGRVPAGEPPVGVPLGDDDIPF